MKTELQDITVEMDRITLGELLEEGKLTFQGVVGIYTMYIFYTIIKTAFKKSNFHCHGKTLHRKLVCLFIVKKKVFIFPHLRE